MGSKTKKRIWAFWHQGADDAPLIVKKCFQSWTDFNPTWELIVIDKFNLDQYVNLSDLFGNDKIKNIPLAALSDIIRINLLQKYGGVWVDATCFCNMPLDEWLDLSNGFFAFDGHRRDTLLSSWFLGAEKDNELVNKLCDAVNQYWIKDNIPPNNRVWLYSRVKKLLNYNSWTTQLWFTYPVQKWLKIRPYFWFHYLFAELIKKDNACSTIWANSQKKSGKAAHILQKEGLLSPLTQTAKEDIDDQINPVYKLNWKLHKFYDDYDPKNLVSGSNIEYLIKKLEKS